MKYDPDAICAKCNKAQSYVQHCDECAGWGIATKIRFHKFVPIKKANSSNSRTSGSRPGNKGA